MIKVLQTIQQYLVTNSFPITTIIPITYNTCNMDSACARTWPSTSRHSRSNRFGRIPRISAGLLAAGSRCRIETPYPPLPCAFSSSTKACLFLYSCTLSCLGNKNHVSVKNQWQQYPKTETKHEKRNGNENWKWQKPKLDENMKWLLNIIDTNVILILGQAFAF